jgi:hypothetical protein
VWHEHERVCGARTSLLASERLLTAAFALLFNAKLCGRKLEERA